MQGTRMPDGTSPHRLKAGEYAQVEYEEAKVFFACSPDGRLANLAKHFVTEHPDGTITVSPSILVRGGGDEGEWHGFLERGVWREAQ